MRHRPGNALRKKILGDPNVGGPQTTLWKTLDWPQDAKHSKASGLHRGARPVLAELLEWLHRGYRTLSVLRFQKNTAVDPIKNR